MGPKNRVKGTKRKENEELPKPTKSQYHARIAELNAVLAQVRKETLEMEEVYFATEKKYETLQEDMVDIIKYLDHEMKESEEEIARYDIELEKHNNEVKKQKKYYDVKYADMDEEYNLKKRDLTEKIQSANAKLNSFEEMRMQREDLVKRREDHEKLIEEMTERHKEEKYQAEKQAITEQDKLQREMENRLVHLAVNFREATDMRIGETTNNIIEENIKLGNQLTCHQDFLSKMRISYSEMKVIKKNAYLNLELNQGEYGLAYEKYRSHEKKIEYLLEIVDQLTGKIEELQKLLKANRRIKRKITELECSLKDVKDYFATLAKSLKEVEDRIAANKKSMQNLQDYFIRLQMFLFETAKMVKAAIECENVVLPIADVPAHVEHIDEYEEPDNRVEEDKNETSFRRRENLIKEIWKKLKSGISMADEMHLTLSASETYDININNRFSLDSSSASKRSILDETSEHEESKKLTHIREIV